MAVRIPFEAALDDKSANAVSSRMERIFADAGKDAGQSFSKQFGATAQSVEADLKKIGDKASDAYDKARDAAGKLRSEEEKLKDLRDRGARDSQIVSQAERLEAARRAEVRATRDATAALRDYESAAQDAGRQSGSAVQGGFRDAIAGAGTSGTDMASEFVGGFAGSSSLLRLGAAGGPIGLALAGVATLGVVAGQQLGQAIADGMATIQLQDQFQASMGLNDASMSQFANAAGSAFANNFGASLADNLATAQGALRSGLIDTNATDAEIQTVIQQLQGMAGVTGATTQELSRSITTLMRTGLAGSVSEASDIITAGFQGGLDVSGDWLDTINEYSTQFRKLGLDSGQVLTLLSQGLQGGARDTDKVADSLKEFSIRAVDGSKLTAEGFAALGFNADDMGRRFAAGGETAEIALGSVLTALKNIDDPMQQSLVWTALFGTQVEDMGDAINNFDLSAMGQEFTNLQGVSDSSTKTATSNFASEWETATRTVSQFFSDLKTDIAEWATSLPLISDIPQMITAAFNGGLPPISVQASPPVSGPGYTGPMDRSAPLAPGMLPGILANGGPTTGSPGSLGDLLMPSGSTPVPGAPGADAPVPGAATPILTDSQAQAQKDAEKAAAGGSLPTAPSLPINYTATAGLPTAIANAQTRLDETRHALAEKEARVNQLLQANVTDADVIQKARNDVAKAEQDQMQAERSMSDAQVKAAEQQTKQVGKVTSDLSDLGASLDADFGLSKGLGGVIENAVKALGNALAAPFLQALGMVEKANPNEGSGLVGMLAANGSFGQQYTPAAIAAATQQGTQQGYVAAAAQMGGAGYAGVPIGSDMDVTNQSGLGLLNAMGLRGATYSGHTTDGASTDREVDVTDPVGGFGSAKMTAFAQFARQNPGLFEEFIYNDPSTGQKTGIRSGQLVGPGTSQPGYYADDWGGHQDHAHIEPAKGGGLGGGADQATGALTNLAGAAQQATGALAGGGWNADWNAIAQGESGGNWGIDTGNGYSGGLQFSPSSWQAAGGTKYAPSANLATPYQQAMTAEQLLAMQGPGAWPNTFVPGSSGPAPTGLAGVPAMAGGGMPGLGMPQSPAFGGGMPGIGNSIGQAGPGVSPGTAYPSTGGNSGNIMGGLALDGAMAATAALDTMAPGSSAAAKIGIQLANRAVGYAAQNAGIIGSGALETFSLGDNPKGSLGASWLGKGIGGLAGAAPALPNIAGGQKPPAPNSQQGGGAAGQGGNTTNQTVNVTNNQANENQNGGVVAEHLSAMQAPAGRQ